jgi:hypothetical protein
VRNLYGLFNFVDPNGIKYMVVKGIEHCERITSNERLERVGGICGRVEEVPKTLQVSSINLNPTSNKQPANSM